MTGLSLDTAQQILDSQPFSGLVGARIAAFAQGTVLSARPA